MSVSKEQKHATSARRVKLPSSNGGPADWATVSLSNLRQCLAVVANSGGALRLGYSRDGGAYAIGIYGDGDPYTVYVRPSEDIAAVFDSIAEGFMAAAQPQEQAKASKGPKPY